MHWRMSAPTLLALWVESRERGLGLRQHNNILFWMGTPVLLDRAMPYKQIEYHKEGLNT